MSVELGYPWIPRVRNSITEFKPMELFHKDEQISPVFHFFFYPQVVGLNTNIRFLMALASHQAFQAGDVNTDFIPNHQAQLFPPRTLSTDALCQAALAMMASLNARNSKRSAAKKGTGDRSTLSWYTERYRG